jgi:hypothetical protein
MYALTRLIRGCRCCVRTFALEPQGKKNYKIIISDVPALIFSPKFILRDNLMHFLLCLEAFGWNVAF